MSAAGPQFHIYTNQFIKIRSLFFYTQHIVSLSILSINKLHSLTSRKFVHLGLPLLPWREGDFGENYILTHLINLIIDKNKLK